MIKKSFFLLLFFPILLLSISLSNGNSKNNSLNNSYESGKHSYIESGPIIWYPTSNEYSIEFALEIHENDSYDFYHFLESTGTLYEKNEDTLEVWIKGVNNEFSNHIEASWINKPSEDMLEPVMDYYFEINLEEMYSYEGILYSLDTDNSLSINDSESNTVQSIYTNRNSGINNTGNLSAINNEFKTNVFNPYIVGKDGFEILETTASSVSFQLKIIGDDDNYQPPESLKVKIKDSQAIISEKTANYIGEGTEKNTYIYEIDELEANSNYEIISLDNTNLRAVTPFEDVDDEIIIKDSYQDNGLGGDGTFTTEEDNPYIENNGFEILETSTNSVKFQITVIQDKAKSFNPTKNLNVTLKNEEGTQFQTTASYIEDGIEENTYVYEIDELEEGKNYEIFSLDNTGLAISSDISTIDEQIEIVNDLGSDGTFTTIYDNPYILEGGFYINDWTDTTVTYTITVEEWEDSYKDIIDVRLNLEDNQETYQSKFIEKNNDEYTYEITGLNDETNYTFFSLENTGLAVNDSNSETLTSIELNKDLGIDSNDLIFTTYETKIPNYVWIILLIILIAIITIGIFILIRILHKNKEKKINHEINNLGK